MKEAIINDRAIAIGEIADLLSQLRALTYAKVAHDTQIVAAQARAVVEREATLNSPPGGAKSEENSPPAQPARWGQIREELWGQFWLTQPPRPCR